MNFKTTRQADGDIIDIYVHGVAEFGVDQAERYHEGMVSVFELLAEIRIWPANAGSSTRRCGCIPIRRT
jgi:plasmid stabilization system protein ParE